MSHVQAGFVTVSVVVIAAVQVIDTIIGRWRPRP